GRCCRDEECGQSSVGIAASSPAPNRPSPSIPPSLYRDRMPVGTPSDRCVRVSHRFNTKRAECLDGLDETAGSGRDGCGDASQQPQMAQLGSPESWAPLAADHDGSRGPVEEGSRHLQAILTVVGEGLPGQLPATLVGVEQAE